MRIDGATSPSARSDNVRYFQTFKKPQVLLFAYVSIGMIYSRPLGCNFEYDSSWYRLNIECCITCNFHRVILDSWVLFPLFDFSFLLIIIYVVCYDNARTECIE